MLQCGALGTENVGYGSASSHRLLLFHCRNVEHCGLCASPLPALGTPGVHVVQSGAPSSRPPSRDLSCAVYTVVNPRSLRFPAASGADQAEPPYTIQHVSNHVRRGDAVSIPQSSPAARLCRTSMGLPLC